MIEEGSIFIADYPLIHRLTNIPDVLDSDPNDERNMRPSKSPIAFFASIKNCFTGIYELKSVAIQMDFNASKCRLFYDENKTYFVKHYDSAEIDSYIQILLNVIPVIMLREKSIL